MPPEQEPRRHTFVEEARVTAAGSVLEGDAAGAPEELDDHLDAEESDHLTLVRTDANRTVGVDRDTV